MWFSSTVYIQMPVSTIKQLSKIHDFRKWNSFVMPMCRFQWNNAILWPIRFIYHYNYWCFNKFTSAVDFKWVLVCIFMRLISPFWKKTFDWQSEISTMIKFHMKNSKWQWNDEKYVRNFIHQRESVIRSKIITHAIECDWLRNFWSEQCQILAKIVVFHCTEYFGYILLIATINGTHCVEQMRVHSD